MKKISNILKVFTIAVICFSSFKIIGNVKTAYANSYSEVVIEKISGRVLHQVNQDAKLPMASTTKILTAITVIDNFPLDKIVAVPKECQGVEGSSIYLKEGDKFSVQDLLYGLMLRSGNDSAKTLAVCLSGSQEEFVSLMNVTAKKCGAVNSNFTNPHGLHDQNHYTTALDLALITRYALQNPTFAKIVQAKSYVATELNSGEKRVWKNKNKMLFNYEGATGVKTGYTKKAGRCLVSSAKRKGMEVISVVLNVSNMFEKSQQLLTEAFDNYDLVKIIDSKKFDYKIPNVEKSEYYSLYVNGDVYYPIEKNERLEIELDLPKHLDFIPEQDQKVGEIKIYSSKQLIFLKNIYTLINN